MILAHRWRLAHVMHYVGRPLLALFAWDVLVAVLYVGFRQRWVSLDTLPMPLIGSALALFVSLRNSSAYARWWEARVLFGGVVTNARTFARQVRLYLPGEASAPVLVELMVAYAHALRCHLRRQPPQEEIARFVPNGLLARLGVVANVPNALLAEIADRLSALARAGALDTIALSAFDTSLGTLGTMQGGAERIRNTPLPRQYSVFPRVFVVAFCFLLPLAMVSDLGIATPLGSSLVGFIFLALDRVGADLEDPFRNGIYDVPLSSLTRSIEIDLRQSLGQTDLPPALEPVDGVLW